MSQQTSGHVPTTAGTDPSTTQVARDEATQVGRATAEAGQHVAGTAKDQAGEVVQEARRQAKDLLGEARGQAAEQARNGQQKATEGLRALAAELHQMADGGEQHGPASDLAKQAADPDRGRRRVAGSTGTGRSARGGARARPPPSRCVPGRCGPRGRAGRTAHPGCGRRQPRHRPERNPAAARTARDPPRAARLPDGTAHVDCPTISPTTSPVGPHCPRTDLSIAPSSPRPRPVRTPPYPMARPAVRSR